jgi:hypothetical protein
MEALFSRLFRYRERAKRSPREDFLTEALAALLVRMPVACAREFVAKLFVPSSLREAFTNLSGFLEVGTQVPARGKRIDLLVSFGGQPAIVVENKLQSGFQKHELENEDGDHAENEQAAQTQHQLVTYGRWLSQTTRLETWPGVVVLLTHGTLPPDGFVTGNAHAYGSEPHTVRWREVHLAIDGLVTRSRHAPGEWLFVARELRRYLEDQSMSASDIKTRDMAALSLFSGSYSSVNATFTEILDELYRRFPDDFTKRGRTAWDFRDDRRIILGWLFFQNNDESRAESLSWGLRFFEGTTWWVDCDPPLPRWDHAFLYFGFEDQRTLTLPAAASGRWSVSGDKKELVTAKPFSDLSGSRRFAEGMVEWVAQEMPVLDEMRRANLGSRPK